MTSISPHKRDECGVAYQTTYISEYGPRCTGMMASVFFFPHLQLLWFIILSSSLCAPSPPQPVSLLIHLFINLLKSLSKWHKPADLY